MERPYVYASNNPVGWTDPWGLDERGHHIIPEHLWKQFKGRLQPGVEDYLDNVLRIVGKGHNATAHGAYNKLIGDMLGLYLGGKSVANLTLDQVKEFAKLVHNDEAAKLFNSAVRNAFNETAKVANASADDLQKLYGQHMDDFLRAAADAGKPGAAILAALSNSLTGKMTGNAVKVEGVVARVFRAGSKIPKLKIIFVIFSGATVAAAGAGQATAAESRAAMTLEAAKALDPTIVGVELMEQQTRALAGLWDVYSREMDMIDRAANDVERRLSERGHSGSENDFEDYLDWQVRKWKR